MLNNIRIERIYDDIWIEMSSQSSPVQFAIVWFDGTFKFGVNHGNIAEVGPTTSAKEILENIDKAKWVNWLINK